MQNKVEFKAEQANYSEHHKTPEVRALLSQGAIGGLVSVGRSEQTAGQVKEQFGTLTIEDRTLNIQRKDTLANERIESIEPQIWESSPGLSKELEKVGRAAEKLIDLSIEKLPTKDAEALFKSMTLFERSARWRGVDSEQVAGTYEQAARPGQLRDEDEAMRTRFVEMYSMPLATLIQLVEQMHSAGRLDRGEFDRLNKLYESMKGK